MSNNKTVKSFLPYQSYQQAYQDFDNNPSQFWLKQSERLQWFKFPKKAVTQDENGRYRWFEYGQLNTCYLALDYHIEQGREDATALIYDSPLTNSQEKYSYLELQQRVTKFASALAGQGVKKGDRVVIYMPMIPEAVIGILACARLGVIHSVVFGGFAASELSIRIDDAQPKVILSASCGLEIGKTISYKPLLDQAIELSSYKPALCIILQRPQVEASLIEKRDKDWISFELSGTSIDPVILNACDPLYILYTSGTTGKPKGVVRDNGGHAVAMHYSMEMVYGMKQGEVFWAASDVGWVVGHSYIIYAPLIFGSTTILYEGKPIKTPDPSAFWRVIAEHHVTAMFTAPTAFRAIIKEDPNADYLHRHDLSSLKRIFLAGERLDPATYDWLSEKTNVPILDNWWQTETGWAIVCNPIGVEQMPVKAGSATVPTPGYKVEIINDNGDVCNSNEQGAICIKLPLPPGCLPTIWQNHQRFQDSYLSTFPGYYLTGDGGYIDDDGYLFIMGRMDDVINVAGHRLSTGEMEEIVAAHPAVAECAVFPINDQMKGQLPVGMVVLKDGVEPAFDQIQKELVKSVREKIGPIACFQKAMIVERLPKTRSGKILRRVLRQMMNGEEYVVPSTIDDPEILNEILKKLR